MDSSGPVHIGATVTLAARRPVHPPPDTSKVTPGAGTGRTGSDPNRPPDQEVDAALARPGSEARAPVDPQTPAGPPPAFDITLLEIEADLRQIIARIEAARAHRRQDATAPTPAGEEMTASQGAVPGDSADAGAKDGGRPAPEPETEAPRG